VTDAPTTASGLGLATFADDGTVLDAWFPEPRLGDPSEDSDRRKRLEALAGRDDVRLALLTGNFRASAEIKLAAFDVWRYFTWGAFADDAIERDDLIRVAHERHEVEHGHVIEPESVEVIGDTPHDIRCARAGGAKAIAVATGNYDLASLERHSPDALFADLTDTDAVLKALLD
jgi:phosphoglycolate phosphatase